MHYLLFKRIVVTGLLALCFTAVAAQESPYSNIGSAPTQAELNTLDISIMPNGDGLPTGQGTASQGEPLYFSKCAVCHGPNLEGRRDYNVGRLAGGVGTLASEKPVQSFGSFNPYATTLWDYIRRAMPRFEEGSLTHDQIYALSAYILYKNDIIGQDEVMNADTLPKVKMPNRDGFIPSNLDDIADIKARGCRIGHCP
jgi:S-disulfanyl-L-cysteine oxidoreductase SoxD